MIGRRAIVGLSLLSALLFCAIAAQSAFAQLGTAANNTTAFTCVLGGGEEDFKDGHCNEWVGIEKGDYGHVAISNDTTTELEITNDKTPMVFKGTFAGVSTEVSCSVVVDAWFEIEEEVIRGAFIHNVQDLFFKEHTVTGQAKLRLGSCTVTKPSKCVIKQPFESETLEFRAREGLGWNKNEMGVEFNGGGPGILFQLTFENKGAEKCALAIPEKPYQVRGSMIGTGQPAPTEEHTGGTLSFYDANEMETLEVGPFKASLTGTLKMHMAGGGFPIAFTTVT